MKHEIADEKLTGILDKLTGALPAQVEERVMREMANAKPVRARSRRRLIAIAVGAAVVLFALGFVPFPMGKATGALERAMAAAVQATTVHIIGMESKEKGDFRLEKWLSEDGFAREERWQDGKLTSVELDSGGISRHFSYVGDANDSHPYATENFDPIGRHKMGALMPRKSYIATLFQSMQLLDMFSAPKTNESKEVTLWGGSIDVAEIEGTIRGEASIGGVEYHDGDMLKIRAEIDPNTGCMVSMTHYLYQGNWEQTYKARYDWDVTLPANLREFNPPSGTKLVRNTWWQGRADKVIATAKSQDWEVTLHAIEVNQQGDIILSLQRNLTPESGLSKWVNGAIPMRVEATDDEEQKYTQLNRYRCDNYFDLGYWVTTLKCGSSVGNPKTVTLTIYPYPNGMSENQFVVLRGIALPSRQKDPFKTSQEVIQY